MASASAVGGPAAAPPNRPSVGRQRCRSVSILSLPAKAARGRSSGCRRSALDQGRSMRNVAQSAPAPAARCALELVRGPSDRYLLREARRSLSA